MRSAALNPVATTVPRPANAVNCRTAGDQCLGRVDSRQQTTDITKQHNERLSEWG